MVIVTFFSSFLILIFAAVALECLIILLTHSCTILYRYISFSFGKKLSMLSISSEKKIVENSFISAITFSRAFVNPNFSNWTGCKFLEIALISFKVLSTSFGVFLDLKWVSFLLAISFAQYHHEAL